MKKRLTNEEFINRAIEIHGNEYDYSKINYVNKHTKIEIICSKHGSFLQRPDHHLYANNKGCGCPLCALKKNKRIHTKDLFILDAIKIHGNKYDYSHINYVKKDIKISIKCPVHGIFLQTPQCHLAGQGCNTCGRENLIKSRKSTLNEFLLKSKQIHGNKYDYSYVDYKSVHRKVKILCPNHGYFFQTPNCHTSQKHGCPICVHRISKQESEFLDFYNITERNINLGGWKLKQIDGYDPKTNTVYEFLGDYWHGNPEKYDKLKVNKSTKKLFGELYENTFKMLNKVKCLGYNVKYIWEADWKRFKDGKDIDPKIITH